MAMVTHTQSDLERCARVCHECQDACLRLIPHCLDLGGPHAAKDHINMLIDCATICGASHSLLHRGSPHHVETCRACAAICQACAEDCRRVADGDGMMRECADMCEQCAESCRGMIE